jgi:hypothetical protein
MVGRRTALDQRTADRDGRQGAIAGGSGSGAVDVTQAEDRQVGVGGPDAGRAVERPVTASSRGGGVARARPERAAIIAVVEDEPGVRSLAEQVPARGGHRVLAFADGASTSDALIDSGTRIDLLLTDLVMPGPNAVEVARRFRRDRPELPVLLMSGYAADALRAEGIAEDAIEILAKPFTAAELLEQVTTVRGSAGPVGAGDQD